MTDNAEINGRIYAHLFNDLVEQLAVFLRKVLPKLSDDWWNEAVVIAMTYKQKEYLKQQNITSLDKLDLSMLLRVLDQNWHRLSSSLNANKYEARHCLKEMQTVRDRWAHASMKGFPIEDLNRDLDTMQRLLVAINAEEKVIRGLHETKMLISPNSGKVTKPTPKPPGGFTPPVMDGGGYTLYKTDKNKNSYYFRPALTNRSEEDFIRKAYENGRIFLKIDYPDGFSAIRERRVGQIWTSPVYWNINTMNDNRSDSPNHGRHLNVNRNLNIYVSLEPIK